jgi:hypothetical protein
MIAMMPEKTDLIRELQTAVLRRCEERIERSKKTGAGCYSEAGNTAATTGITGILRSRHGM